MITCNTCIHNHVCRFVHEAILSIDHVIEDMSNHIEGFELTRTEIRHILASHCPHFKAVTEIK